MGQEPVLFANSIKYNIMQGFPSASKEDFIKACEDAQLNFVDNLPELNSEMHLLAMCRGISIVYQLHNILLLYMYATTPPGPTFLRK